LRERERSTSDRPNDALNSVMSFPANGARARVSPNFIDEVGGRGLLGLTSHAPSLLVWMDWVQPAAAAIPVGNECLDQLYTGLIFWP